MREVELRRRLARTVHLEPLPDAIWHALGSEGLIGEVLECAETEVDFAERWQALCSAARRYVSVYRAALRGAPRQEERQGHPVPPRREAVTARARALSTVLAQLAAAEPEVCQFRACLLAGRVLTADEAEAFVASPALQWCSGTLLRRYGIPPVGHTATVLQHDRGASGCRHVRLHVAPPGVVVARHAPPGTTERLTWPRRDGGARWIDVQAGSVLDALRQLGEELAARFPWDPGQAGWFVLTGLPPWVAPVRAWVRRRYAPMHAYVQINLAVEPWVPAAEVLAAYRALQQKWLPGDNRLLGAKTLALATFFLEQSGPELKRPPWRTLQARWNAQHPAWGFRDVRQFAHRCREAVAALLAPPGR